MREKSEKVKELREAERDSRTARRYSHAARHAEEELREASRYARTNRASTAKPLRGDELRQRPGLVPRSTAVRKRQRVRTCVRRACLF